MPKSAPPEEQGKTRDKVAASIGIGHDTLRKAQEIAENKDKSGPAEFCGTVRQRQPPIESEA